MIEYLPVLVLLGIGLGLGVALVAAALLFGPNRPSRLKNVSYECGLFPTATGNERFSAKFYLVAVLFILFDVETVYLIPWAVVFRDFLSTPDGLFAFASMVGFMVILFVGLIYVLRKRVLDWNH